MPSIIGRKTMGSGILNPSAPVVPPFNPLTDVTIPRILWGEADGLLYKDAAKTELATANNDLVYVADSNGQDFIQATEGGRPKFKTNIVGSMPGLFFDGIDDFLATASFDTEIGFGGYTLFLSVLANVGSQIGMFARGTYAPTHVIKANGVVSIYAGGENDYNAVMDASPHVLAFVRPDDGSNDTRLYVDGVLDAANPGSDVSNWVAGALSLGCIDGAGLQPFSGYKFGWGLFKGAMIDAEREGCEGHLLGKLLA